MSHTALVEALSVAAVVVWGGVGLMVAALSLADRRRGR